MCKFFGSPTFLMSIALLLLGNDVVCAESPERPRTVDQRIDALLATRVFKEVAISPNGRWLAWVEEVARPEKPGETYSAVFVGDQKAKQWAPRQITAGKKRRPESDLAWSPNSDRLAFLSDDERPGQLQLYAGDPQTGKVIKLTNITGHLTKPKYSRSGAQIAILFTENALRATGPTQAATPEVGVMGERVDEQRLSLVDQRTGKVDPISPADHHVYEYDWSPDGKKFVAIAAEGDGDNNWYIAKLLVVEAATKQTQILLDPGMQIAMPRWSPDGSTIALIGGLMSDEGIIGGDVYTVSFDQVTDVAKAGTVAAANLTPELKGSASWLAWRPSSREIVFTAHVDGESAILSADVRTKAVTTLWKGAEVLLGEGGAFGLSLSEDQKTTAIIRHSYSRPPEVWSGEIGKWQQRTHQNDDRKPLWGEFKSLHWKSDDFTIQGWLLYPREYDPQKKYPMVVSIHGGPSGARRPGWPSASFDFSFLADAGYFVFFPNPRGSFGQGSKFTRANVRDFGHGDLRDILAGVEYVVKTLPVDDERLGVVGWSYGGYMTMWTVTQTNRFKAAVAGAGISNWQSYYGQNGIDQWMIPFFGKSVYDDPAIYARSSPMNFIKQVKTPTLVLVGERDLECPAPQSLEFWRALRRHNVSSQLMIYPNEGHAIRKPENRRDILKRSAEWLDRRLKASGRTDKKPVAND